MKLHIEKMVYGGSGLARIAQESSNTARTIFVPFTLPGELAEVDTSSMDPRTLEAPPVGILQPSPERVAPSCIHFGQCGGCQYQHAGYPTQVEIKAAILSETLERAGQRERPEVVRHFAHPWEYRNRIRLRLSSIERAFQVGYSQRGSAEFLSVRECPIAAPLLWRAAQALCEVAAVAGTFCALLEHAAEVEFFCDAKESCLQMVLFLKHRSPRTPGVPTGFQALCDSLKKRIPELIGGGLVRLVAENDRTRRRAQRTEKLTGWGAEGLKYSVAEREYWLARGGFFQINRFLVDDLLQTVASGRSGSLAWDLYAGVGLFSLALTETFDQVVAVEGGETAAAELLRISRRTSLRAVHASTQDFLAAAVIQRERPDLIVADPPRAGLGPEVCALLARIAAPELVYVSCDPVSLGRDLKLLTDSGYGMVALHLFDLFPQTFHMETVVVLRR